MKEMGGLFNNMKVTAICFGAGTLALMGIPIFNGFFSKDLILETAFASGNYVMLVLAALAAVMTVIYSLRMYSLVFFGQKKPGHAADAPWQMTLPLMILAAASIVSWLLVTKFNKAMIASGLEIEHLGFGEFLHEMFLSPVTAITVIIIISGLLLFFYRKAVMILFSGLIGPYLKAASSGFGFDTVYYRAVAGLLSCASYVSSAFDEKILNGSNYFIGSSFVRFSLVFRKTHTGLLNYNLLGMLAGIIFVLVWLFW
jgi:NADH-quinone oxidoreductase subunit L